MYKKVIILLTFLGYSLTLVHSLVPHHHHEKATSDHHHHGDEPPHHHSAHDDDHDKNTVSHVFADAIHHPASEIFVHAPESKVLQKKTVVVDISLVKLGDLLSPELKPPDAQSAHRTRYSSSDQDTFFLLRAPPIA